MVSVLWGLADAPTMDVVYAARHKALADTLAFFERTGGSLRAFVERQSAFGATGPP